MRILFFITLLVYSSTSAQIHDYNKDGYMDTVRNREYIDGKTGDAYAFIGDGNFSDFIDFIAIPKGVEKYPEVMDSLEKKLYSRYKKPSVSPPLLWLIDAYNSQKELDGDKFYSRVYFPRLRWLPWPAEFPEVGYTLIAADTVKLPHMTDEYEEIPPFTHGWITYYGHNHRQYRQGKLEHEYFMIRQTEKFQLYKTSHGLLIRNRENRYAWVFHSNGSLTGGPSKLRWSSLGRIHIQDEYIFVHHRAPILGSHKIFVISVRSGKVGQIDLKSEFSFNNSDCYSVIFDKNWLHIRSETGEYCERQDKGDESISFDLNALSSHLETIKP